MSGPTYMIREGGLNGTVVVHDDRVVRTYRKAIGRNDTETIPMGAITGVHQDRRALGSDWVVIVVGPNTYRWKVKDARRMVAYLLERMQAYQQSRPG